VTNPSVDRARLVRRRREHSRQILIFGVLGTALAAAFTLALLIFDGIIDAPFARGFTTPHAVVADTPPPCLPEVIGQPDGALPVPYDEIDLRIYNGSGTSGVATANQTVLGRRGFAIEIVGDWAGTVPLNQMRFGVRGIASAYTVAAHFPPMQMILDDRTDASVDLIVGDAYDQPLPTDQVSLAADRPLLNMRGCEPASSITPIPAPGHWRPAEPELECAENDERVECQPDPN
jgi:hypothetical protein